MQKKQLFFVGAVLCLAAAAWGYYQYQKPRAAASAFASAYKVSAEELYAAYSRNETAAGKKYNNQVIEVRGNVADVQQTAQGTTVLLASGTAPGGVNCSFQKGEAPVTAGETITVKGRCTGFLMDVNLVDAVRVAN